MRPIVAVHGFCTAAPDKQSALDGHVVQHDFAVRCAAADDEVAIHGHILERHIVGADQDASFDVLVVAALYRDIAANDIRKNLRKFCAGDVVQRSKDFAATVDIVSADHCPDVGQRPAGNVLFICKFGQIRFRVFVVVQLQRSCYNGHRFLPADQCIRGHCRRTAANIRSHLHGEGYILVVPLAIGYVLVLTDVRGFIAPERAVDDCCHFCAGHVAIGIEDGTGFAVKQAIIYGRADRLGIPCGTVIVLEICCFAGSRSCRRRADGQR